MTDQPSTAYPNDHQEMHYDVLGLCGCGSPEDAYNFCRDVLVAFDRRGKWDDAEGLVKTLILARPDQAAHVIAHMMTHLGVLEHGGSVGGSWLTNDGERIVDLGPMTEELMYAND